MEGQIKALQEGSVRRSRPREVGGCVASTLVVQVKVMCCV